MLVSICIIANNEEQFLPIIFEKIKAQSYPHDKTEIIFVDNLSTDKTRGMMVEFALENKDDYNGIYVYDSPKNLQATAWNTALINANGDVIIRLDAHSSIPPGFVSTNVKHIQEGEDVCGGGRPNKVLNKNSWSLALLAAEQNMFGGIAGKYRRVQTEKEYLSSVFHGAYRKEVFANIGGFNENLGRTEDNEFHYRLRQAGYKIACFPDIVSYQYIRNSFSAMLKQKFSNGYWVGLTLGVCKGCLSLFYFAPLVLLLAYLMCGVLCCFSVYWPLILLTTVYMLFNLLNTVPAFWSKKVYATFLLLPLIFPFLHIAYGIGSLIGIIKMPFWKRKLTDDAEKSIEKVRQCFKLKLKRDKKD